MGPLLQCVDFWALAGLGAIVLMAELAFYLSYWRPRHKAWNVQPCSPHAPARLDAMDLFRRFLAAGEADPAQTNLEAYLSIWFQGISWDRIKRGNMEELFAYGFWYRTPAELQAAGLGHLLVEMVDALEVAWKYTFPPGYTEGVKFMAHMWEDLKACYYPLAFYAAMEACSVFSWAAMRAMGFKRHRLGDIVYYTRGLDGLRRRSSGGEAAPGAATPAPAPAAPILFLHGVGGLLIYLELIWRIVRLGGPAIAVDIRHVGMRLSPRIPCVDEMTSDILAILDEERVAKACVVGHSYGTLVASRLVKRFPSRLHSLCLIDPVCFGMYMPHLLHNFFYRRLVFNPSKPLQFFLDAIVMLASRDLHLATAFSRRFYWSDVIMWPEELPPGSAVVLGAADDLVHADEVYNMLRHMCGATVRSIYNPGAFHGAFLVFPGAKAAVMDAVGRMARSAACDSHMLAEAAAHDAAAPETALLDAAAVIEGHQHADEAAAAVHAAHEAAAAAKAAAGPPRQQDGSSSLSEEEEEDEELLTDVPSSSGSDAEKDSPGGPAKGLKAGRKAAGAAALGNKPSWECEDAITAAWDTAGGACSPRAETAAAAAAAGPPPRRSPRRAAAPVSVAAS